MNHKASFLFTLLVAFSFHQAISQDEFFNELRLEKRLIENEKWELVGEGNWKYLYNEPRWRRWGISAFGARRIKQFRLQAGTNGFYTFNRSIANFFELRPWAAILHDLPLIANISLRQRARVEWRFFYEEGKEQRQDYRRVRYQVGIDIPLFAEEESRWRIRPYFEWYFVRDPATFERFPNERDYGFNLIRRFENEHDLSIGYRLETFYNTEDERGNGHLFVIGYTL